LIKCKSACKAYGGSAKEVQCSAKCYSSRNLCRKDCISTCSHDCHAKRRCRVQCGLQFKNKVSKTCTRELVPVCQGNCIPKCNKKCNKRDNEKCLLVCASQCIRGCYHGATRTCVKKSQTSLRVCKSSCSGAVCSILPACGGQCLADVRPRFSKCAKRKSRTCPSRCGEVCRHRKCKTVACQATCNGKCNEACFWLERKSCHIDTTPRFRKCLRKCSGWCPFAENKMVEDLKREQLGTNHGKCHRGCVKQRTDATVNCFMRQRHKCPRRCTRICKVSKCTTDGCRDRCTTKCTNTCYILLKKKCSLLAQTNASQCMKKC